ncbi:MAG: hypothetical protein HFI63_00910 [Lachnospiraceae bacterium]|nr:hypothetical protein [Lachnospiraceae bacterium]
MGIPLTGEGKGGKKGGKGAMSKKCEKFLNFPLTGKIVGVRILLARVRSDTDKKNSHQKMKKMETTS